MILTLTALFLSSAFFLRPYLPGWLQPVTNANPAAYVIATGQQLMSTGNAWGQDLRTLAAVAVTALVLIQASVGAFRAATATGRARHDRQGAMDAQHPRRTGSMTTPRLGARQALRFSSSRG